MLVLKLVKLVTAITTAVVLPIASLAASVAALNTEKTFDQLIDHSKPIENNTFKQRYIENRVKYQPGGPIILFVSGLETVTAEYIAGGPLFEVATTYKALLINLEHRFVGNSQPFKGRDLTLEHLEYLTIEQALEDIAYFITEIRKSEPELEKAKVVLAGTEYSGGLITWFRAKYPELAVGAWSSSGIINAMPDAVSVKYRTGIIYRTLGNQACYDKISAGFEEIELLLNWEKNAERVEQNFKLCNKIDLENKNDVMHFFHMVSSKFSEILTLNDGIFAKNLCVSMLKIEDNVKAIASALYSYINPGPCFDTSYTSAIKLYKNVNDLTNNRVQLYMKCKHLGWFPTSTSRFQPFGYLPTVELFSNMCKDVFDTGFTIEKLKQSTDQINSRYGGLKPNATKVFTSQGEYDPNLGLGIESHHIADGTQANDLQWWLTQDRKLVTDCRNAAKAQIGTWLK